MQQQLVPMAQRFGEFAGPGGPGHDHGAGAGWWTVSIITIVLLATIAGLLIWLGRRAIAAVHVAASPEGERAAALQALDLRLAQGDVTPTDYRARREALTGAPVVAAPAPSTVDPDAPTEVQDQT